MSDESKPLPLRLKPRLRPDEGHSASSPDGSPEIPTPAESTSAPEAETPKLRLKPRLAADTSPDTLAESAPATEVPAESGLRLKPKLKMEPESAQAETPAEPDPVVVPPPMPESEPAESAFKLKLKPKDPAASPPATAAVPPSPPAAVSPPPMEPPPAPPAAAEAAFKFKLKAKDPTTATPTPAASKPPIPPPSEIEGETAAPKPLPFAVKKEPEPEPVTDETAADEIEIPSAPKKRKLPGKPSLKVVILVGLVMSLIVVGVVVWKVYLNPPPAVVLPTLPVVTKPVPADSGSLASQVIEKAIEAAAEQGINTSNPVDEVMASETAPVQPKSDPNKEVWVTATTQKQISANVTATVVTELSAVQASPEFQSYVAQLTISGVFQGSPARALINEKTYQEGDLMDPVLGVRFDHIEVESKYIIFRDASGATVKRRY